MTVDHVRTLFDYTYWARDRLYAAVERVPHDEYVAPRTTLDYGSIHKTLLHMYGAELNWFRRLKSTPGLVEVNQIDTLGSLRSAAAHTEKGLRAYLDELTEEQLAHGDVTYTNSQGNTYTRHIWMVLAQLVNHATQHRSEIALTISALGHSPGDFDLPVYFDEKTR
ncbi:MAG: hypothetical protein NVSMB2_08540 [Chloroflexota bacterium]